MEGNRRLKIFLYILPFLVVALIYTLLLRGFFVQDEWYSYGWYILHNNLNLLDSLMFHFSPNVGHYNPFTNIVEFWLFSLWGLNYFRFAVLSILMHILVVISVFFLSKRFFKGKIVWALLAAFIFGIFASTFQGVSWVVVNIATLTASLIGTTSAVLFLDFISSRKVNRLIASLGLLIISLLFKEITIGLFPLYFLTAWWYFHKGKLPTKYLGIIILVGCGYLLFRFGMFFLPSGSSSNVVTQSLSLKYLIYNFLTIPFKSLTQILIPPDVLKFLSQNIALLLPRTLTGTFQTTSFDRFVEHYVIEALSLGISVLFILYGFLFLRREKSDIRISLLFCFGWVILNSYIFSLAPDQTGVVRIVDSRNLYFVSIGLAILIGFFLKRLYEKRNKLFLAVFLLIAFLNIFFLVNNLSIYTSSGQVRRKILERIVNDYPKLSSKTIFFVESDTSYYGLPENTKILPFQSGFGQTLLAWYESKQKFPSEFFKDNFLWDIEAQDYKEVDGVGFGYFRDFKSLTSFMTDKKLDPDLVLSFTYNSKDSSLKNITSSIKNEILGALSKKRKISIYRSNLINVPLPGESPRLIDGDPSTIWNSKISYSVPQAIEIKLPTVKRLAEIEIDSPVSGQDGVRYKVSVSNNNKDWINIFEQNTQDSFNSTTGITNLYFKPTSCRFVRIEVTGAKRLGTWVIGELKLYEAID